LLDEQLPGGEGKGGLQTERKEVFMTRRNKQSDREGKISNVGDEVSTGWGDNKIQKSHSRGPMGGATQQIRILGPGTTAELRRAKYD